MKLVAILLLIITVGCSVEQEPVIGSISVWTPTNQTETVVTAFCDEWLKVLGTNKFDCCSIEARSVPLETLIQTVAEHYGYKTNFKPDDGVTYHSVDLYDVHPIPALYSVLDMYGMKLIITNRTFVVEQQKK